MDKPDERSVGQFEDEFIGAIGSNKGARLGPMRKFLRFLCGVCVCCARRHGAVLQRHCLLVLRERLEVLAMWRWQFPTASLVLDSATPHVPDSLPHCVVGHSCCFCSSSVFNISRFASFWSKSHSNE